MRIRTRWGLLLAVVALAAVPSTAGGAELEWSGTMTVSTAHGGPNGSGSSSFTGAVTPSGYAGSSLYRPLMLSYRDHFQRPDDWCANTSTLQPGDVADEDVPIYVDLRGPAPLLVPHYNREWSFPRHNFVCLAFDGGELKRYQDYIDGATSLNEVFYCDYENQPYTPPYELPFAYAEYSRVTLPAAQDLGDGRVRVAGTITHACDPYVDDTSRSVTLTVDLIGEPPPPDPPEIIEVFHDLTVEVRGTRYGRVFGAEETIACGQGLASCVTRVRGGGTVRLAALTAPAGRFLFWEGCDQPSGQSCVVTPSGPRTVRAWFGYDFVGQYEPPPEGLFDPARKAEIAGNGATGARDGAIGCASTAGVIYFASGSLVAAGATGAATRWQAAVQKAFEETVGNCLTGVASTIYNGVLLKVDPPDPAWRTVALAERFPRAKVAPCRKAGCAALTKAQRAFVAANARVASLQEAIAVAANRYGNAANARDEQVQALHQATMRATSALLAGATAVRNRAGARLAKAIRGLGIRRLTLKKAAVGRALKASAAGRGIPRAVVRRMLRKKLITRAGEVKAMIRAQTPKRAVAVDVLAALRRPVRTRQMRAAAAEMRLADVTRLLDAVTRDTGATAADTARYQAALDRALRCDARSQQALRDLAAAVTGAGGIRGEGGLLVAAAARQVAASPVTADDACRA